MTDPLSSATRAAKRNLLAACILTCTYKIFSVSIKNIPIADIEIGFDKGAFAFLGLSCLIYFTITFVLYYWIDIKNIETTTHQRYAEETYYEKLKKHQSEYIQTMIAKVKKALTHGRQLNGYTEDIRAFYDHLKRFYLCPSKEINKTAEALYSITGISGASQSIQMAGDERQELLNSVREIQTKSLQDYYWDGLKYRARLSFSLFAVKALYLFRNYIMDGIVPVILAGTSFLIMYNAINLEWIKALLPSDMR